MLKSNINLKDGTEVVRNGDTEKEVRYMCGGCEDWLFCEYYSVTHSRYEDGCSKPSDDKDGKYTWVCPGNQPSQK